MPKATKKTLKDLQPVVNTHQSKLTEEAKTILKQEAKPLFDYFPEIEGIRWTQRRPLENPYFAPVHKSDFSIDNVEYCEKPTFQEDDWASPWGDGRIQNKDLLDSFSVFEEQLFENQDALAAAVGDYDRVTITRKEVVLDNF
jgi:hypothetical protein